MSDTPRTKGGFKTYKLGPLTVCRGHGGAVGNLTISIDARVVYCSVTITVNT